MPVMINPVRSFALLLLLLSAQVIYCQINPETPAEMKRKAVTLMDNGEVDESLKLLKQAQKLDPDNIDYPYEMAYAYILKKDYKEAVKTLEKIIDNKNVTDQVYQLLGNSYDYWGKSDKALEAYDNGLKKFPNSGKLYLEKGNVYLLKKDYNKAVPLYERGIEVDPTFPSNYYRLTLLFCNSKEPVWGLLYGELFLNLESGSKRFYEVSKLLYDTYREHIQTGKDSSKIDFCEVVMNIEDLKDTGNIKFPFCMVFGQAFILAITGAGTIDVNSLDKIRTNFISFWFQQKYNKTHPNVLYEYEEKIRQAGHLEAYNHYILAGADPGSFKEWAAANKEKLTNFFSWYRENRITLDANNKFFRKQY